MSRCQIITADVLTWAEEYDGPPFHALLCDPPYHLNSIIKRFAKTGGADRHFTKTGPYQRTGKGFMGQTWDGGDIAFQPETWAALGKHLHPGAFMMAFAGTRGYHRMACAIEDAGFVIHPLIIWAFGSGFPKSTRIKGDPVFDGHRYGLQAMKPALECICVAQKPYAGRPVDSIAATGAGVLNIDGARVGPGIDTRRKNNPDKGAFGSEFQREMGYRPNWHRKDTAPQIMGDATTGRWPANICFDREAADALDRQSGERNGGGVVYAGTGCPTFQGSGVAASFPGYEDQGGASRYYHVSDWLAEEHDPFFYTAKAGRTERDSGLDGMPMSDLWNGHANQINGSGEPAKQIVGRNFHPTVKPLRLTRWLATLLLPPSEYAPRRILVPFAGSGSEAIGAALAGWDDVTGLEMSEEYAEIARARARFWQGNVGLFESLTAQDEEEEQQGILDLA